MKAFYRETRRNGFQTRLAHGTKMAWRHSAHCVGRASWLALNIRDLRHLQTPDEVFAELRAHLKAAWNGGRIKALVSVLGPGGRIVNNQLIRYAGYDHGPGDPQNAALTPS